MNISRTSHSVLLSWLYPAWDSKRDFLSGDFNMEIFTNFSSLIVASLHGTLLSRFARLQKKPDVDPPELQTIGKLHFRRINEFNQTNTKQGCVLHIRGPAQLIKTNSVVLIQRLNLPESARLFTFHKNAVRQSTIGHNH